jgi:hypothetical protein
MEEQWEMLKQHINKIINETCSDEVDDVCCELLRVMAELET